VTAAFGRSPVTAAAFGRVAWPRPSAAPLSRLRPSAALR